MQAPEENIRGHRPPLHHLQKQLAGRLNNDSGQQWRKGLVFGHGAPAVLIGGLFGGGEGFQKRTAPTMA